MTLFDVDPVQRDAIISDCGRYRYRLSRIWDEEPPVLVWCMLNPSTADASVDDRTIGRCNDFARGWGYGGIVVVNLFAFRATDPAALNTFGPGGDPIGPLNNDHLLEATAGEDVICAWGASVPDYWRHRPRGVAQLMRERGARLHHLGLTKTGQPKHPLYLRGDTQRTEWTP